MTNTWSILLIFCILLMQSSTAATGIEEVLIIPSVGAGSLGGLMAGGEVRELWSKYSLSQCIYYASEKTFLAFGPNPKMTSLSICGILNRELLDINNFSLHVGIGLEYIHGIKRGALLESSLLSSNYEKIEFNSIGIPIEFSILKHFRYFGYGAKMFANVNFHLPYVGMMLCTSIGRHMYRKTGEWSQN